MKNIFYFLFAIAFILGCAKDAPLVVGPDDQPDLSDLKTPQDAIAFLKAMDQEIISPQEIEIYAQLLNHKETISKSRANGETVEVPADSQDALADAISEAGEGGTVILKAGNHMESGTMLISHKVTIEGEDGAVLISQSLPGTEYPVVVDPAIHILNASGTVIKNLDIRPAGDVGGTAILIQSSTHVTVTHNTISQFQNGVLIKGGNRARITFNNIAASGLWATGEIPESMGVIVSIGDFATVNGNTVSNALAGIWSCARYGVNSGNTTDQNFIGQLICKVPDLNHQFPDGSTNGSEFPGTKWLFIFNTANTNGWFGYLVIDGANRNALLANKGSGNATYDMELTADTERFGFLTPKSENNLVYAFAEMIVKDCGEGNKVVGGTLVDNEAEPCN